MSWTPPIFTNILIGSTLAQTSHDIALTGDASGNLYVVFNNQADGNLYLSKYRGAWSPAVNTGVSGNGQGAALAWLGQQLYLLWNNGDQTIHYAPISSQGIVSAPLPVPQAETNTGPAAIGAGKLLVCSHVGKNLSTSLYASTFNGSSWTKDTSISQGSNHAPSLATAGSDVYLFHCPSSGSGQTYWSKNASATSFGKNTQISQASSTFVGRPAAASYGSNYLVLVSNDSQKGLSYMVCSLKNNSSWAYYGSCWSSVLKLNNAPGLWYTGGTMFMVLAQPSTNYLMMSTLPTF